MDRMQCSPVIESESEQPNILLILTYNQSKMDMGAYGNEIVGTPCRDQIAWSAIYKSTYPHELNNIAGDTGKNWKD